MPDNKTNNTATLSLRLQLAAKRALKEGKNILVNAGGDIKLSDLEKMNLHNEQEVIEHYLNHPDTMITKGDYGSGLQINNLATGEKFLMHPDARIDYNDNEDKFEINIKGKKYFVEGGNIDSRIHEQFEDKINYLAKGQGLTPNKISVTESEDLNIGEIKFRDIIKEGNRKMIRLSNGMKLIHEGEEKDALTGGKIIKGRSMATNAIYTISERAEHESNKNENKGMRVIRIDGEGFRGLGGKVLFHEPNITKSKGVYARDAHNQPFYIHESHAKGKPEFHMKRLRVI